MSANLHERRTMCGVFTVKDEKSVVVSRSREETLGELLFITEVQCTLNVSTVVLVLEAAINDGSLVIQVIVGTVKHLDESFMSDARKALGLSGCEVRQLERCGLICIHYRGKATR